MIRATTVIRRADIGERAMADTITLDRQSRHRRRVSMTSDRGQGFLLDLPEATYLAGGDALQLDNGRFIRVVAAPESLLEQRLAGTAGCAEDNEFHAVQPTTTLTEQQSACGRGRAHRQGLALRRRTEGTRARKAVQRFVTL